VRIATLKWAGGIFCVILGAMMLALPDQFEVRAFAALAPHAPWSGAAFLLGGGGLLIAGTFALPRWLAVAPHFIAGCELLLLAHGYARAGVWTATTNIALLGVGIVLAPALARLPAARPDSHDRDLLALLLGLGAAFNGLAMLVVPRQFAAPVYDLARPHLAWFGTAFLAVGVGLVALQTVASPRLAVRMVHLLAAGTFFAFLLLAPLPSHAWAGVAFYGAFGATLALLPWAGALFTRVQAASLRVRFVMALAAAMTLAMIVPVVIVGDLSESAATAQVMETQRVLASALARDIHDVVTLHRNAVATLAAVPGLLQMTREAQRNLVATFHRNYPDAAAFVLVDAAGRPLARSDDRTPLPAAGANIFEEARLSNGPSFDFLVGPSFERPVLQFAMAIHGPHGEFAGVAGAAMEPNRIFATLARAGARATADLYLVDRRGHAIAHLDPRVAGSFADLSGAPPVAALLADRGPSGAVKYTTRGGEALAAYARVPDLDWGVIIERPASAALAIARAGRETSFLVHFSVMVLVAITGAIAAGALAGPLEALAREAGELDEGVAPPSLLRSNVPEIARLSAAFEEMRRRLAARTAERERAEDALRRRAQELARSNAELEEFAYVASHDLQEPLRIVKSYLQLLEKRYAGRLDGAAHQFIAYAVDAATRMQQLINDLLAYSRVGTRGTERSTTDCEAVLEDALGGLKVAMEECGAVVTHDPLPAVMADGPQLRQVFQNLIGNALKFRNSARPQVHVSAERQGDGWVFSVRDNGIGIAPEYVDRIFVIFQRLHARNEYSGTGIGLAICKKIVERHGGRIWVESQPGRGATFRFTIPDGAAGGHA
jgi:signal transduction histidine kinase